MNVVDVARWVSHRCLLVIMSPTTVDDKLELNGGGLSHIDGPSPASIALAHEFAGLPPPVPRPLHIDIFTTMRPTHVELAGRGENRSGNVIERLVRSRIEDRRIRGDQLVVPADAPDARAARRHQRCIRKSVARVSLLRRCLVVVRTVEHKSWAMPRPQRQLTSPNVGKGSRTRPGAAVILRVTWHTVKSGDVGKSTQRVCAPERAAKVVRQLARMVALHGLADKRIDPQRLLV
mmetsp:Transcript_29202/g.77143  ORF Transcript_29202/g.77143 Transcript_29202/m.77143 type:complete len:234 (-) Transcript_29202:1662-2363(-)